MSQAGEVAFIENPAVDSQVSITEGAEGEECKLPLFGAAPDPAAIENRHEERSGRVCLQLGPDRAAAESG